MSERVSTGVPELDREIDGGVYPGSIVVVLAPPASQSEALLHATMRERRTRYVTTRRNETAVSETLSRVFETGSPGYSVKYAGLDEPLANVRQAIALVEENAAIVVDTVDPLERTGDADRYVTFLNELKDSLIATGSIGVLHAAVSGNREALRDVTESFADVVLEVEVQRSGSQVEHMLSVPKFRAHDLPGETIKLELGSEVRV
ncbi:MAG: RAD55 family ATPase, partial [Halolamina sp.]